MVTRLASRLASAATSGFSLTPVFIMASRSTAPSLVAATRWAPIWLNIRNTLKTGRLMPFDASTRKPAKYGWSSNSKAQVSAPSRFTP